MLNTWEHCLTLWVRSCCQSIYCVVSNIILCTYRVWYETRKTRIITLCNVDIFSVFLSMRFSHVWFLFLYFFLRSLSNFTSVCNSHHWTACHIVDLIVHAQKWRRCDFAGMLELFIIAGKPYLTMALSFLLVVPLITVWCNLHSGWWNRAGWDLNVA